MAKLWFVCLVCMSHLWIDSCSLPASGWFPIKVSSATITLQWDPPAMQFYPPSVSVAKYRIYWRPHTSGGWNLLAEIPATAHPALTIKHSQLSNGAFDFAVRSVNALGGSSSLHSSLDASATPFGGWYIVWSYPGETQ
jgi:hypothetical protein